MIKNNYSTAYSLCINGTGRYVLEHYGGFCTILMSRCIHVPLLHKPYAVLQLFLVFTILKYIFKNIYLYSLYFIL